MDLFLVIQNLIIMFTNGAYVTFLPKKSKNFNTVAKCNCSGVFPVSIHFSKIWMMFKRQIWKFLMSLFKVLNVKKLWTLPSWNISKSFTFLKKKLKKAVDAWYGCVSGKNNSFWHFTKQLFLILYSLNDRNSMLRVNTLNVENSVSD